jgi:hypothetical membrane protein
MTPSFAGFVAPMLFIGLVILQGVRQPDYDHVRLPISALAAWPLGWVQVVNFCVTGMLCILFARGMHRAVMPLRRNIGAPLLMLNGLGLLAVGAFSWKMVDGVPTETPAHVVGAVVTFVSVAIGLASLSRRFRCDPAWSNLATYTLVTGLGIFGLFVTLAFYAIDVGTPLHPWAGLIQRLLLVVWFAWIIVAAMRLRHIDNVYGP